MFAGVDRVWHCGALLQGALQHVQQLNDVGVSVDFVKQTVVSLLCWNTDGRKTDELFNMQGTHTCHIFVHSEVNLLKFFNGNGCFSCWSSNMHSPWMCIHSHLQRKERDLTLDLSIAVLPVIRHIFASPLEPYLAVALEATSTVWHAFGELMLKTLATKSYVVDVMLEERCTMFKNCTAQADDENLQVKALSEFILSCPNVSQAHFQLWI